MSLTLYLEIPEDKREYETCPHCDGHGKICRETEYFSRNITHNLTEMASEAGVYCVLWEPKENGYNTAADIIDVLKVGLQKLIENPKHFRKFNASNGWGTYENFVSFVKGILAECEKHQDAILYASR